MGQVFTIVPISKVGVKRLTDRRNARRISSVSRRSTNSHSNFVDLKLIPPEIALNVLSHLNATDLCLASCVWNDLGNDDMLWKKLCHLTWPFCSKYKHDLPKGQTYWRLYLMLDEARLTFNADAFEGLNYLLSHGLLEDNLDDLVSFLSCTSGLSAIQKSRLILDKPQILTGLIKRKNYHNNVLPNALRHLFAELPPPEWAAYDFVSLLVSRFSERFAECNPTLGLSADEVYLLCFSLIMLSGDLWSPHVKNKMSKREFIRNTRTVSRTLTDDFLGHLYDNVYIIGHVVLCDLRGPPKPTPEIRDILS